MKRLVILLCISLLFSSCGSAAQIRPQEPAAEPSAEAHSSSQDMLDEAPGNKPEADYNVIEAVYNPEPDMTAEEIVKAYFEQMYLSYIRLAYIDVSALFDMTNSANRNMLRWSKMLVQRRRLLQETGLCYVETEEFPYTIEYDEVPEDGRMDRWKEWQVETGNEAIHFRIKGEGGKAYPPIMALNSQHTIFFREIDGMLKITLHYFPGSVRKFLRAGTIKVPDEAKMLEELEEEFAQINYMDEDAPAQDAIPYNAGKAVSYALKYTEKPNPDFYYIGDWVGNCANFTSQCLWAGFGGKVMTTQWNGGDGGTAAWENVNYFWSYITSGQELYGRQFESAGNLKNGDIIQSRTATIVGEEDRFTHMMIVSDEDTMTLAQNSPACFVYYSDLVNVKTRFIRPTYIIN